VKYRQSGVALIIVLGIALILSTFAVYFVTAIRSDVKEVSLVYDHGLAKVKAESTLDLISFWLINANNPIEHDTSNWNIFAVPFVVVQDIEVTIQDVGGALSLIPFNSAEWLHVLDKLGVERERSQRIIAEVQDWQDLDDFKRLAGKERRDYVLAGSKNTPRNHYMQSKSELKSIASMDEELYRKISPYLVYYGLSNRAPRYMSEILIDFYLDQDRIAQLQAARAENRTGKINLFTGGLVGAPDVLIDFSTQSYLITIRARVEESVAEIKTILMVREGESWPFFYASVN